MQRKEDMDGYGISDRASVKSWIDEAAENLRRLGYSIILDVVQEDDLQVLRDRLEYFYEQQVQEFGGHALLDAIKDRNVLRAPLAYDKRFLQVATAPEILNVCQHVLGENFVLTMQNGLINQPAAMHEQGKWHRDLNYQHWVSSKPLALNFLICLDDFTSENGATFVLPSSHLIAEFPSDTYLRRNEIQLVAPAGAALVLDAMTFHRAGSNRSSGPRRAINHVIGLPFIGQQISMPSVLGDRFESEDFLQRYLGYRWQPQPSPLAWRQSKIKK